MTVNRTGRAHPSRCHGDGQVARGIRVIIHRDREYRPTNFKGAPVDFRLRGAVTSPRARKAPNGPGSRPLSPARSQAPRAVVGSRFRAELAGQDGYRETRAQRAAISTGRKTTRSDSDFVTI